MQTEQDTIGHTAVVLDACVLFPTVMRELLLGVAAAGFISPVWSARILEEWARAAGKSGSQLEAVARGEIALCRARWPEAETPEIPGLEQQLYLPDAADRHVLAAAIGSNAKLIVTMNLRDFPRRLLIGHGVQAQHPDQFLSLMTLEHPVALTTIAAQVRGRAEELSGGEWPVRKLMKKARLPRFAKALERLETG